MTATISRLHHTFEAESDAELTDVENETTSSSRLSRYFFDVCDLKSEAVALETSDGEYTFGQLWEFVEQIQVMLKTVGVLPLQVVAICMDRSPELIGSVLGCIVHGAVFMMLNPSLPNERIAKQIIYTKPRIVLCSHYTSKMIASVNSGVHVPCYTVSLQLVDSVGALTLDDDPSAEALIPTLCFDDTLYIIFTSGSTGTPKAVCASASGTLNRLEWMWREFPFEQNDVVCFKTSLAFVDCIWEILGSILKGIRLAIASEDDVNDVRSLITFIDAHKVTRVSFVPSYLRLIVNQLSNSENLKGLTLCISSGESLTKELALNFVKTLPSCRLLNLYGSSEVCGDVTYFEVTAKYLKHCETNERFVPIGKPIQNVSISLVNPITDESVTVDSSTLQVQKGQIAISGNCVALCYLQLDDSSLQISESGVRIFYTSDVAYYLPSGNLIYSGRSDNQVKLNGQCINPGEIEAALEQHSMVSKAVVRPNVHKTSLVAYIQVEDSHSLLGFLLKHAGIDYYNDTLVAKTVKSFLKKELPQYMMPHAYVSCYSFPKLPSGKINKLLLPSSLELQAAVSQSDQFQPSNCTEATIQTIFKSLLHVTNFPVSSDFFSLGGNSLLAVELASRLEECFHHEVPLSIILKGPDIVSLAKAVEKLCSTQANGVLQGCKTVRALNGTVTEGPLSCEQEAMYTLQSLEPESDGLVISVAGYSTSSINTDKLREAVKVLISRHPSLRTELHHHACAAPSQEVLDINSSKVSNIAESAVVTIDCSKECPIKFQNGGVSLPRFNFDLHEGPLWQLLHFMNVRVPYLDKPVTILAMQIHHIISDGWSVRILITELEWLLLDLELPEKTYHLNFIQHATATQKEYEDEVKLSYWERQLKNAEVVPFLQPDWYYFWCRQANDIFKQISIPIDDIQSYCKENSMTEFILIYAGFVSALYALSGSDDITIFLAMSNREPKNKDITGPFVNTLPLRTKVEHHMTLKSLFQRIRKSLDEMMQNSLPYHIIEKILLKSGKMFPEGTYSITPCQILFVYDYGETTPFGTSKLFNNIPVHCNYVDCSCLDFYVSVDQKTKMLSVHVAFPKDMYRVQTVDTLLDTWNEFLHTIVYGEVLLSPIDMLIEKCLPHALFHNSDSESDLTLGIVPKMCHFNSKKGAEYAITVPPSDAITWNQLNSIHAAFLFLFRNVTSPMLVLHKIGYSARFVAIMASCYALGISPFQTSTLKELSVLINANSEQAVVLITHSDHIEELQAYARSEKSLNTQVTEVISESCLEVHYSHFECTIGNESALCMSNLNADVRTCLQIITDHAYPEDSNSISSATIFASSDSPTMVIALSFVIRGVSVKVLTQDMIHIAIKYGSDVIVLPESIVPHIFPTLKNLVEIQKIWIHGLPLALAHMTQYKTLCPKIFITHSLLPNRCHISHVLKLNNQLLDSIKNESCYIPVGHVHKRLQWSLLYRDGRLVQSGYTGEFVAIVDGQKCHSGVLVRQNAETNSHELIARDSKAFYNGKDFTNALTVLSKMPVITWCYCKSDDDILYYAAESDKCNLANSEQIHDEIKERLLVKLPLTPCFSINLEQVTSIPITRSFLVDHDKLLNCRLTENVPKVASSEIEERIVSVLSKEFQITPNEAKKCCDLVSLGSLSLAHMLSLTVELNREFGTILSIDSVAESAVTTSCLIDLIASNVQ